MIAPLADGSVGALAVAPLLGVAFGWFLERGGLGYAPRLAGQFYLTDLTVFKVMFSALLTAMLGAFWLDRMGLIDLKLVDLPETFLAPQAVGGAIFGAGFLVAGLCPGTSCVAAAAGKLDGLGVIAGMLGGIAVFNVVFPAIAGFYASTARGALTLSGVTEMPPGVVVAAVTAMALVGFVVAERLERRKR